MKKVYESKYVEILLDIKKSLIRMNRFETTKEMSEDDYKKDMTELINLILENNIKYSMVDMSKFEFIIVPELQDWANKAVVTPAFKNGLIKAAFIESKALFANISSQQTMEDNNPEEKPFKYFDNETDAFNWLFS